MMYAYAPYGFYRKSGNPFIPFSKGINTLSVCCQNTGIRLWAAITMHRATPNSQDPDMVGRERRLSDRMIGALRHWQGVSMSGL